MVNSPIKRLGVSVALAIGLAGCQTPQEEAPLPSFIDDEESLFVDIEEKESSEDRYQTPEMLMSRAKREPSPKREYLLLKAVDAFYRLGRIESGDRLLVRIKPSKYSDLYFRANWVVKRGQKARRDCDWKTMERLLVEDEFGVIPALPSLPSEFLVQWGELKALYFRGTGQHLLSVQQRIELDRLLEDRDFRQKNHDLLWESLIRLPENVVASFPRNDNPTDELHGWVQLVQFVNTETSNVGDQQAMINQWRNTWPQHPGNEVLPTPLYLLTQFEHPVIKKVAVLLPMSGPYKSLSDSVMRGVLSAHFASAQKVKPAVVFYDTMAENTHIADVYDRAVIDGADFVIGPIDKNQVEALNNRGSLPIPTLALNYLEEGEEPTDHLFQFGLRAEDELDQMARPAESLGYRKAILLTPKSEWGERLGDHFKQYWTDRQGYVLGNYQYVKGPNIGQTVQRLLDVPASKNRFWTLTAVTKEDIDFRARRRQDIDFILTVAAPQEGRQIKPQLAFHYASKIPMFSTSQIYERNMNKGNPRDINGVVFCEIPWELGGESVESRTFNEVWPTFPGKLRGFAALGVDAYKLHDTIHALNLSPGLQLRGSTGYLNIKHNRSITRRLSIFEFKGSTPVPVVATAPDEKI